jgi:hypothetical protein
MSGPVEHSYIKLEMVMLKEQRKRKLHSPGILAEEAK